MHGTCLAGGFPGPSGPTNLQWLCLSLFPYTCWCLLRFPEAELAAFSPLPPVMLPQASAPSQEKATQPEPEPLHALRECLFLLPGYLIMAKGVSNLGLGHLLWSPQSPDSLPQFSRPVHLHGQDLGRDEQEFMQPYVCSSTFSLHLFPISLEFGTGSGSVRQPVHRRSAVHPLPCPPQGAELLNGDKFCIAL